jgi:hypothetical protein
MVPGPCLQPLSSIARQILQMLCTISLSDISRRFWGVTQQQTPKTARKRLSPEKPGPGNKDAVSHKALAICAMVNVGFTDLSSILWWYKLGPVDPGGQGNLNSILHLLQSVPMASSVYASHPLNTPPNRLDPETFEPTLILPTPPLSSFIDA